MAVRMSGAARSHAGSAIRADLPEWGVPSSPRTIAHGVLSGAAPGGARVMHGDVPVERLAIALRHTGISGDADRFARQRRVWKTSSNPRR